MNQIEREAAIKKELTKLKKVFADIPNDKKTLCERLIQNAAFMAVTLQDLQDNINVNGPISTGVNGNGFEVTTESAAQKSYNTTINRYSSVISQLTNLLPDDATNSANKAGAALAAFIAKGKDA